jgi:2-polyprenyl-3-methyl-5-hydroxy-6-metoxy-1,4-benzoquinol methylase
MTEQDPSIQRVQTFYDQSVQTEWERLDRHPVEFAVTMRVLQQHLPPPPARILDLGSGPGRYAIALSQLGYQVSLADLSPANIAFAKQKAAEAGIDLSETIIQEATQPLPKDVKNFDAVLLMGPLYHLVTREKRVAALNNAINALKPQGLLFASFITLFGALRAVVEFAPDQLEEEWKTLQYGINRSDLGFTDAYFARIPEIYSLMAEAEALEQIEILGCEGFSNVVEKSFLETQLAPEVWEHWVDLNLEFGRHPTALEASDHILYVARKL